MYYYIMTEGIDYVEQGLIAYQKKYKEQQLKRLQKQAKILGLQFVSTQLFIKQDFKSLIEWALANVLLYNNAIDF